MSFFLNNSEWELLFKRNTDFCLFFRLSANQNSVTFWLKYKTELCLSFDPCGEKEPMCNLLGNEVLSRVG